MDPATIAAISSAAISGASLATTSIQQISSAIGTNRNCTLEITNYCRKSLTDPEWYCESGRVKDPLPVHILPQQREAASFTKTPDTARGSVFVFSYKLDYQNRIAVLVSIPYSTANRFGAKFMAANHPTNEDLYKQMYYKPLFNESEGQLMTAEGRSMSLKKGRYKVDINMSDESQAVLKMSIYKDYGTNRGPQMGPNGALENWDWILCANGNLPEGAFVGGEENGKNFYVIRAKHEDALIPGKLVQGERTALITWQGNGHKVNEYEVLVGEPGAFKWEPSSQGYKHAHAVIAGRSERNEPLLIGRGHHEGRLHPGHVHPRVGKFYIYYEGQEVSIANYDILIH